jgi:hypothetical protein
MTSEESKETNFSQKNSFGGENKKTKIDLLLKIFGENNSVPL